MNIQIDFWEMSKALLLIFWTLWPLWLFVIFIIIIRIMIEVVLPKEFKKLKAAIRSKKGEKWRADRDRLQWLRGMKPSEFEDYISNLFSRLGYKTQAVGKSHDGGIDVIAEKGGVKNYIQCKKFITSEVTVGDVRSFYGALVDHLTNGKGYFITTNRFTLEAEKFAEDKPIELVDGYKLISYIKMAEKGKKAPRLANQSCPRCRGKLVQKNGKFGVFYGCSNYPKCTYTTNLKNN